MIDDRLFIQELFEDKHVTCHETVIYVDMDMEPWEVGELIDEIYYVLHKRFPKIKLSVDGYRTYEEEYGGFLAHGILTINMEDLTRGDIALIKKIYNF